MMHADVRQAGIAALVILCSGAAAAQMDGVRPVPRVTGTDPVALARRLQALEDRVDNMWSLSQGPEVVSIDTLDRLSSRLLAVEARLAGIERGGAAGTQPLLVSTTLALLSSANFPALVAAARRADPGAMTRARYFAVLVRLTPWPEGLKPKATAFSEALSSMMRALSRGEPGEAESLAMAVEAARRQLAIAGLAWTAQAPAPEQSHGHGDHSPRRGGLLAMSGDLHVEVVAGGTGAAGTYEVYLSDAFRRPLSPDGVTGAVVLWPGGPRELRLPLKPMDEGLVASGPVGPGSQPLGLRIVLEGTPQGPAQVDLEVPATPAP